MFTYLTLTNFKGFQEATVPLGPLTLLVGTNASGKSNVREAFQFLHGCSLGYRLTEVMGEKWGNGVLLWRGPRGGAKEIVYRGGSSFRLETTIEVSAGQSVPYMIEVCVERDGKLSPHVIEESLQGRSVAEDESSSAKEVITELRGMRFLDLAPQAMREPSLPGQTLGDQGENLSSVLLEISEDEQRKRAIIDWIRALTPMDVRELRFKEDLQGRVLVYLVEGNGSEVSAYSASDGTLRFLALVAALLSPPIGKVLLLRGNRQRNSSHPFTCASRRS